MTDSTEFSITKYTQSPLRLELKKHFSVTPQVLFDTISDHHAVAN
ncbi:MAG: hypothetical protein PSV17_07545 [Methylotenera sp.]|nr:hypothetical protein [Methylotenera sp.]MDI1309272.1 hypothetical protein [Methylotenera sp.]